MNQDGSYTTVNTLATACVGLLTLSVAAVGTCDVTTYDIVSGFLAGSVVSGGQGSDCPVSGSFDVLVSGDQITFDNAVLVHDCASCGDFFPSYPGTITGGDFAGEASLCPGLPPFTFVGQLWESMISFSGTTYPHCVEADRCTFGFAATPRQEPSVFSDGFESGDIGQWSAHYPPIVGDELVITLPGDAVTMTLVYVPPGTFQMGSPTDERGRWDQEDLHEVTLTTGYYVGKYEATQGQWEAVMGSWPNTCGSYGVGADYPVYCVSWNDIAGAAGFVETLNAYLASTEQVTGFRLPTEAEWERAARGGNQYRFSHGDVLECDDDTGACPAHNLYMWWGGSQPCTSTAHPVGSRLANGYGLFDMHGNEGEYVQDWLQWYLGTSPVTDPTGPGTGSSRVVRGGDWSRSAQDCRSATRFGEDPPGRYGNVGFRLARTAD